MARSIEDLREFLQGVAELRTKLNESDTRRVIIDQILALAGWDLLGIDEVRTSYDIAGDFADYVMFRSGTESLVVEAKALGTRLDTPKFMSQVVNYSNSLGVRWCFLTDGREWRLFCVHDPVPLAEKLVAKFDIRSSRDTAILLRILSALKSGDGMLDHVLAVRNRRAARIGSREAILASLSIKPSLRAEVAYAAAIAAEVRASEFQHLSNNTFRSDNAEVVQIYTSGPYKGNKPHAYIKVKPNHFDADWLAIMRTHLPVGWIVPSAVIKEFLTSIAPSDRTSGEIWWDPKVVFAAGKYWMYLNWESGTRLDVTAFAIQFGYPDGPTHIAPSVGETLYIERNFDCAILPCDLDGD